MNTFDDKLYDVVQRVEQIKESIDGENGIQSKVEKIDELDNLYASKEHIHRISDLEIHVNDVIDDFNENSMTYDINNDIFTYDYSQRILKLKTVPSGNWSMRFGFYIYTNDFENNMKNEVSKQVKSNEAFNLSNEDIGYTIVGGSGCAEGLKITLPKKSCLVEIDIDELTGFNQTIDISKKNQIIHGDVLNNRFIYGSGVKSFIRESIIPLINTLQSTIEDLESRVTVLETPTE